MKIRCLLVDDEPLAIQLLQKHLSQLDSFEVVAVANNAMKALEILQLQEIDLLFCDIKMPAITGLDLLKTLKNPPQAILTTAYREFALDSYELDIVDYLLKPITFERFFKAIEKYLRLNAQQPRPPVVAEPFYLTFKANNKFYRIKTDDILYVESQKDYVKIVMTNRELTAKYKISDVETDLANQGFLRVHRSFVVNQRHIVSYSAVEIEVGAFKIPVGESYKVLLPEKR